jgi:pimeloyl-ACP methyl ester carboxylesterase
MLVRRGVNVASGVEYRDVDAAPIAWRQVGRHTTADHPVVFLHGLGGSRLSWDPQLAAVGQVRYSVAWDLPGYGASEPLGNGRTALTFERLAESAARFIKSLGVPAAHVVGISFGGMIAQYLAAWHPQHVRSLTLLATSPAFGLDGTDPAAWRAARLAPLDAGRAPGDFAESVLRSLAGPTIAPEALDQQVAAMRRVPSEGLRRSIDCLITHDSRALLPSIVAPTQCLVGDLDTETPPTYSQAIVDLVPGARLVVVPGVGHLLNAEAPETVNQAILHHIHAVKQP